MFFILKIYVFRMVLDKRIFSNYQASPMHILIILFVRLEHFLIKYFFPQVLCVFSWVTIYLIHMLLDHDTFEQLSSHHI